MPSKITQTTADGAFAPNEWRSGPLLQVRTVYIAFTQGLFAAAPKGSYHWAPSLEDTEIVVTDENPIHVDVVGKRPAITFTRGPVQSYSLGQDDMLQYDFATGRKTKSLLVPGTMSINCCSRVDLESESLAWTVAEQLWMHRELLMRSGFFEIGRQFVIGAPTPAGSIVEGDSADEWYCTTISSPFQFHRTSAFTPLGAEIVQRVQASAGTFRGHRTSAFTPPGAEIVQRVQASAGTFRGHRPTPGQGPVASPQGAGGMPSANLPYNVTECTPGMQAHQIAHPANPSTVFRTSASHPFRPGLRPPTIRGRVLPTVTTSVEQSDSQNTQCCDVCNKE